MLAGVHDRQRGFMAIVLVVFLVVFVAMAAAIVSITTSGARGVADHANASRALFMAESGIEWAALELFDSANPPTDCAGLKNHVSLPLSVNGHGTFTIIASDYESGDESCRLTSQGQVGDTVRVLTGQIPKSVLDGETGGGDDLFDNPEEKFNNCNQANLGCEDGALTFNRPSGGAGQGNTNTSARATDLVSGTFSSGDVVYFTANFEWDPTDDPAGNVFNIEVTNNLADCDVALPALSSSCAAPAGDPLYDLYDVVLILGSNFSDTDINRVNLSVDWGSNNSDWLTLTEGCIGRADHCQGQSSQDPVDDGSWNENP